MDYKPANSIGTVGSTSPVLNGRSLKRRGLNHDQLVDLGADLVGGVVVLAPSIGQVATILGVTSAEISERLRARNGNGNSNGKARSTGLAKILLRSTPAERLEAAVAGGVDLIWDEMVSPLIGGGGR